MSSILFLVAVLGVVLLIVWLMRNDAAGLGGGDRGIFAIKQQGQPQPTDTAAPPRWRRR
jgi:hypothetical protein